MKHPLHLPSSCTFLQIYHRASCLCVRIYASFRTSVCFRWEASEARATEFWGVICAIEWSLMWISHIDPSASKCLMFTQRSLRICALNFAASQITDLCRRFVQAVESVEVWMHYCAHFIIFFLAVRKVSRSGRGMGGDSFYAAFSVPFRYSFDCALQVDCLEKLLSLWQIIAIHHM